MLLCMVLARVYIKFRSGTKHWIACLEVSLNAWPELRVNVEHLDILYSLKGAQVSCLCNPVVCTVGATHSA